MRGGSSELSPVGQGRGRNGTEEATETTGNRQGVRNKTRVGRGASMGVAEHAHVSATNTGRPQWVITDKVSSQNRNVECDGTWLFCLGGKPVLHRR